MVEVLNGLSVLLHNQRMTHIAEVMALQSAWIWFLTVHKHEWVVCNWELLTIFAKSKSTGGLYSCSIGICSDFLE